MLETLCFLAPSVKRELDDGENMGDILLVELIAGPFEVEGPDSEFRLMSVDIQADHAGSGESGLVITLRPRDCQLRVP